jgi:hypothetical protein
MSGNVAERQNIIDTIDNLIFLLECYIMNIKTLRSLQTSECISPDTQRKIPEDSNPSL